MSDFLFSTERMPDGALAAHLAHFLHPVMKETIEWHGSWGSLALARSHFDVLAVVEAGGYITVLVGDPVYHRRGSSALIDESTRDALHHQLSGSGLVEVAECLDGHFAALAVDATGGNGALITDRFSFVGVFHAMHASGRGLVIGTHPDVVARAANRSADIDLASAADLVSNITCTFPWTLYRGVRQAQPGVVRSFSAGEWRGAGVTYWEPNEGDAFASARQAADAARNAICGDVQAACANTKQVGLLLSAGEDSRAVLGAIPPEKRVRAFTFADWESREVRITRRVAAAHGAELVVARRRSDHYIAGFESVASVVGSAHVFVDVHGFGIHESQGLREMPVVLGGLSSDSLLKSSHAADAAPSEIQAIRKDLRREVADRRAAFRDELARMRPKTADEWTRLWPFSMRKHGANVDGNRRLFRTHEVYHSTGVLNVGAHTPVEWKRSRKLFVAATRPLLRRTWHLPHGSHYFPYFGLPANAALYLPLVLARAVRAAATGQVKARHGPWPSWTGLSRSPEMLAAQRAHPLAQSPIASIFEPSAVSGLDQASAKWGAFRRFMLLQLAFVSTKVQC
ncbi:MAG TPA: hypothetical protein VJ672_06330 [Gemmatimonadaceae bacterium]|nr:hypothetical protein [Gemmatimonadaceae bacterium]